MAYLIAHGHAGSAGRTSVRDVAEDAGGFRHRLVFPCLRAGLLRGSVLHGYAQSGTYSNGRPEKVATKQLLKKYQSEWGSPIGPPLSTGNTLP